MTELVSEWPRRALLAGPHHAILDDDIVVVAGAFNNDVAEIWVVNVHT